MTDPLLLSLAALGTIAIIATGQTLDRPVRSAGARRTWLRCLIRSSR